MTESITLLCQEMIKVDYYSNFLIHLPQKVGKDLECDICEYAKAYHHKQLPNRRFEQCFLSTSFPGPFSPERSIDIFFDQFQKVAEMHNTFKGVCVIDLSLYAENAKHPNIERLSEYLFSHREEVIYFFVFTTSDARSVRALHQCLEQAIQVNTISIPNKEKPSLNIRIKDFLESIVQPGQSMEDKKLLKLIDKLIEAAKYSKGEIENRIQSDILSEVAQHGQEANGNIKSLLEQLIIRYKANPIANDTITLGFVGGKRI